MQTIRVATVEANEEQIAAAFGFAGGDETSLCRGREPTLEEMRKWLIKEEIPMIEVTTYADGASFIAGVYAEDM